MTINERIRHLRKDVLKLNQTNFAKSIGMKQTGLSYIEKDNSTVKEQVIKTICMVFNVSENWLLNGIEPIFVELDTFNLDEFAKQRGATDLELQIVKTYFDLDLNTREMLVAHFKKGLDSSVPTTVEKEKTVEELEEEYKKIVLNSASKKTSTALSTINDTTANKKAVNDN